MSSGIVHTFSGLCYRYSICCPFSELNNRKILEDLQIKKNLLQKGVGPVVSTIPGIINSNPLSMPLVSILEIQLCLEMFLISVVSFSLCKQASNNKPISYKTIRLGPLGIRPLISRLVSLCRKILYSATTSYRFYRVSIIHPNSLQLLLNIPLHSIRCLNRQYNFITSITAIFPNNGCN